MTDIRIKTALTEILRDLGDTDTVYSVPETLAGTILTKLIERGYSIHAAPHTRLTPPRTLADVIDRLWTMSGPASDAASRTVDVDRTELRDLAAAITSRADDTWPFSGDLFDYTEMSGEARGEVLAWRALLAVLATTGTTVVIPADLMPPHAVFRIVGGFTLHPDIQPYPYPGGHIPPSVMVTAERRPYPTAVSPRTTGGWTAPAPDPPTTRSATTTPTVPYSTPSPPSARDTPPRSSRSCTPHSSP